MKFAENSETVDILSYCHEKSISRKKPNKLHKRYFYVLVLIKDNTIATGCKQAFYNNNMIKYKPKMVAWKRFKKWNVVC